MIQEVLKKIENSYYWDARVKSLDCNYFGDEVKLVFEDIKKDITYHFSGCYKVKIEHEIEYHKNIASKELTRCQIPYFMQDVELTLTDTWNLKLICILLNCQYFVIVLKFTRHYRWKWKYHSGRLRWNR